MNELFIAIWILTSFIGSGFIYAFNTKECADIIGRGGPATGNRIIAIAMGIWGPITLCLGLIFAALHRNGWLALWRK